MPPARPLAVALIAVLLSLVFAAPAAAERFTPVPALDGKREALRMRFVRYDGSTNGQMVVEVENTSKRRITFRAEGLYFVPKGEPESAPQRLGAAGPIVEKIDDADKVHLDGVALAPGQRKTLRLEVFCIDSHRASPTPKTRFAIAAKRLPAKLRRKIDEGNQRILRANEGDVMKAKPAIQSHMWQTRDAAWVELEGERKQEKVAPAPQRHRPLEQRRRPSR